jgi:hypothetical protein
MVKLLGGAGGFADGDALQPTIKIAAIIMDSGFIRPPAHYVSQDYTLFAIKKSPFNSRQRIRGSSPSNFRVAGMCASQPASSLAVA